MANAPFYEVGVHVGQITRQALTKAGTGNKQLVFGVKILGVPDGDVYVAHRQQYERSIYMTITDKTVPFIIEKLQRLNYQGTTFSQLDSTHPNHVSLVGQQADLWCKHEPRQDGKGMGEKWDFSTGGGAVKEFEPLAAKEMRELDALFGKALGKSTPATRPGAPATPPAATATKPANEPKDYFADDQGITDDDIPF